MPDPKRLATHQFGAKAEVLTVEELAAVLRIGRRQAYAQIREGRIPGVVRLGRSIRISAQAVEQWLHGTDHNGTTEGGLMGTPPLADEQEVNPNGGRAASG